MAPRGRSHHGLKMRALACAVSLVLLFVIARCGPGMMEGQQVGISSSPPATLCLRLPTPRRRSPRVVALLLPAFQAPMCV